MSHQVKVIRQRTDKLIRQQSNYIPWSSVIRMSVPHVSDWCPFNPQSQITSHRNNKKSCCCINISVWLWVLKKQGNFLNSIISIVYSGFWFFAEGLDRCGFRLEAAGGAIVKFDTFRFRVVAILLPTSIPPLTLTPVNQA